MLDVTADASDLAAIFKTFPGLVAMMPAPDHAEANYFAADAWPRQGVRPDQGMLAAARRTQSALPTAIGNLVQIIGCNRETVVRAGIADDEFQYVLGNDGDGTVPLALARLPKPDTYYAEEDHGSLPNSEAWRRPSLIFSIPAQRRSFQQWCRQRATAATRTVRERELRALAAEARAGVGRSRAQASSRQAREVLAEFASPYWPHAGRSRSSRWRLSGDPARRRVRSRRRRPPRPAPARYHAGLRQHRRGGGERLRAWPLQPGSRQGQPDRSMR